MLALSVLVACVFAAVLTPTLGNLWSLATGRGFFVPVESSVFTFRVTEENHGSGEWWLYGEDRRTFFALHPKEAVYLVQSRSEALACNGFAPLDQSTWCSPKTVPTP